ncbi:hypothetical protein ACFU76_33695 [Streptomyces sp. NPDC057539]|uniref:hypothetical protein n=1 Tax=Streptomyces sp. NPDC057539 TaxID=3346159 RepID=UPI00369B0ABB
MKALRGQAHMAEPPAPVGDSIHSGANTNKPAPVHGPHGNRAQRRAADKEARKKK